jgi:transcriptional regulator with XRE-family HTH domain
MTSTPRKATRNRQAEPSAAAVFGKNLREARLKAGMTQAQVAHGAGLSLNRMSLIEQGRSDLRLSSARALARAVGASLSDLVSE